MGDQLRLESALTNFLTHAAKASPIHSQIKVNITMKVGRPKTMSSAESESITLSRTSPPVLGNTASAATGTGGGKAPSGGVGNDRGDGGTAGGVGSGLLKVVFL